MSPGITCGSFQWWEKQAAVNGSTGYLKIKTEQTSSGAYQVVACALGVVGLAALTTMSEGSTAVYTIPEAKYEASCALSVANSWIAGLFK